MVKIGSRINSDELLSNWVVPLLNTNITVHYNTLKRKLEIKYKGRHKTCAAVLMCFQMTFSAPFPENLNLLLRKRPTFLCLYK